MTADKLEQHFGAGKAWQVRGTTIDLDFLAEVYHQVDADGFKSRSADEIESRREDRALQLLQSHGFIKYAGRMFGWKTAAIKAYDTRE